MQRQEGCSSRIESSEEFHEGARHHHPGRRHGEPGHPVRDIAALMAERHITGVPVLTHDGTVIGIVSETDLLHRAELGTAPERKRKRWLDFNALAREYAKAYGLRAEVVMSRCVVAVRDDANMRDVADVLDRHRFKRVPVLQAGQLVGIIARGDLVRALSQAQVGEGAKRTPDAALHKTLRSRNPNPTLDERQLRHRCCARWCR